MLTLVPLLPQHAWDKTSASGKVGQLRPDEVRGQGGLQLPAEAGQPDQHVRHQPAVEGDRRAVDAVVSSRATALQLRAEQALLRAGQADPVQGDLRRRSPPTPPSWTRCARAAAWTWARCRSTTSGRPACCGSRATHWPRVPTPGVAEIVPNLYNAQVGPLLRPAVHPPGAGVPDQPAADRGQGLLRLRRPRQRAGTHPGLRPPWASPLENSGGPYPYSPSKAAALLKAHGWKVVPNGTVDLPAAGHRAVATAGPASPPGEQLAVPAHLLVRHGRPPTSRTRRSSPREAQAGIKLNLKSEPFNTLVGTIGVLHRGQSHPASTCGWQLRTSATTRTRCTRTAPASSTPARPTTTAATPTRRWTS